MEYLFGIICFCPLNLLIYRKVSSFYFNLEHFLLISELFYAMTSGLLDPGFLFSLILQGNMICVVLLLCPTLLYVTEDQHYKGN